MNEVASPTTPPRPANSASPPPKCAICLGTCSNKCFSDSCMHQFCFTCLLEWSKVKPECPLCKQPFKSIIHNIKSNEEYDEHVITNEEQNGRGLMGNDDFLYLPPAPSRHFQFRTTFTVDPGGELAIQQMLLSHPLTNNLYNVPGNYILPRQRYGRPRQTRRASSATSFRRTIYLLNLWVYAPPDVTGRYRDISPQFYRDNPAARNRLVPWLNRELNALLRENTQHVMHLVDVIMDHLPRWHIRSRSFRYLLSPYLSNKTDHFIHEFYNFMRSPYDMIGYDRHIIYADRTHSPTYLISDHDDDSDVAIVNISEPITVNNNPFRRPTIEVIEINSDSSRDSDVIVREPPALEVVNLVDSDSNNETTERPEPQLPVNTTEESELSEVNRKPILPLKIRLKRKRQSKERRSRNKKRSYKRHHSSTTSRSTSTSSDTSESSTSSDDKWLHKRTKRKHKHKKSKSRSYKDHKSRTSKDKSKTHNKTVTVDMNSSSSDSEPLFIRQKKLIFDSDDNIPLSKIKTKELKRKLKKNRHNHNNHHQNSRTHTVTSRQSPSTGEEIVNSIVSANVDHSKPSCSRWKMPEVGNPSPTGYNKVNSTNSNNPITTTATTSTSPLPNNNNNNNNNNAIPSTSNNFDDYSYHLPEILSPYKCEMYHPCPTHTHNTTLPQFGNIPHYDTFQQYSYHRNSGRYSPVVGNRYYGGPDYALHNKSENFTPPLAHSSSTVDNNPGSYSNLLYRNDCRYTNSQQECPHYSCDNIDLRQNPLYQSISRVNVGVGTSPIKNEVAEQDYSYYSGPSSSSSQRMQSVIVKKEEMNNPSFLSYLKYAESTDSDT